MTRFIHDQFAKDYLEELLSPYGIVVASKRFSVEKRQIDVWFEPTSNSSNNIETLGLLGTIAKTPAIIEPFHNPANGDEILDCLLKLLVVWGQLRRKANRNNIKMSELVIPQLWILTPTDSSNLLSRFGALPNDNWLKGIYFLANNLRSSIIVIHQLYHVILNAHNKTFVSFVSLW